MIIDISKKPLSYCYQIFNYYYFKKTVKLQTVLLYNVFIRLKCCLHFKNKIIKEII